MAIFSFWSLWIIVLTSINLALVLWVLLANRKVAVRDEDDPENKTTGHVYDGIEEYDNPLPRWWFMLFLWTFIFAIGYLIVYPGMGGYKGLFGWTQVNQLEKEQQKAVKDYAQSFDVYSTMSIEDLVDEPKALKMGARIFANNCAVCHGSDGGGSYGFPNLTDHAWLYGGTPDKIEESITNGRTGMMPPLGGQLGEDGVAAVTEYVLSLSGQTHDTTLLEQGKEEYMGNCMACHNADGKGSQLVGAPNLTDDDWIYWDQSKETLRSAISHSVRAGRSNVMPAQRDMLRADKIHLLTAYVYSLSLDEEE